MDTLMSVTYRDHNDNKRVYPTDVKNSKHEMPIHIVAMNRKCAQHIVQLLVKDCPIGLRYSKPLIYAHLRRVIFEDM